LGTYMSRYTSPQASKRPRRNLQGCQMLYFHTKNPNFGIYLVGLGIINSGIFYAYLEYFTATRSQSYDF
jgi:hypothetical protein